MINGILYFCFHFQESISFFKKYYQRELTTHERLDFLNFWYLMIIFNDILIIVGSALKEQIENKVSWISYV